MSDPNKQWPDRPMWRCTNCDFTCTSDTYRVYHQQHYEHAIVWSMAPTTTA